MAVGQINLKCSDLLANVFSSFNQLKGSGIFTDVTLVSDDGKQIQAHKIILSVGSEYFKNLLSDKSHPHPMLCLDGVSSEHLDWIIKYLYTGEVSVPQSSLQKFLQAANKLKCFGLNEEIPHTSNVIKTKEEVLNDEDTNEDSQISSSVEEEVVSDEIFMCEGVQVTEQGDEALVNTDYEDASEESQIILSLYNTSQKNVSQEKRKASDDKFSQEYDNKENRKHQSHSKRDSISRETLQVLSKIESEMELRKVEIKKVFMRHHVLEPLLKQKLLSYSGNTSVKHMEMWADRWRRQKLGPIIKAVREDFPEYCPPEKLEQFNLGELKEKIVTKIRNILTMDQLHGRLEQAKCPKRTIFSQ